MATFSLTTTPQTVSTGTDYESFANTGAQRVILAWPTGRSEILWPAPDVRSTLVMTAGGSVSAYVPSGSSSLTVNPADVDESPNANVIDGGTP